jgi:hypothetical protein
VPSEPRTFSPPGTEAISEGWKRIDRSSRQAVSPASARHGFGSSFRGRVRDHRFLDQELAQVVRDAALGKRVLEELVAHEHLPVLGSRCFREPAPADLTFRSADESGSDGPHDRTRTARSGGDSRAPHLDPL